MSRLRAMPGWLALTVMLALTMPTATAAPATATLRPFDTAAAATLRQSHDGRPWILVLWSVNCEPCRNELPHWARMRREQASVEVELVLTDDAGEHEGAYRLLDRVGLGSDPGWAFADDYIERLRYAIDPAWHGELPRTLFYGADGSKLARSGVVDPAWIAEWLRRQRSMR